MNIRELAPKEVWNHFADLNEIPRPSKKEEKVIAFMQNFGEGLGLETYTDAIGNVIIKKGATPGMENRKTVIMQSHLDMVCQKNADTKFDFDTEGIRMYVENDWVKAEGTTLGADNGLGVAAIMAILSSTDIPHPAIEALFTIDEETGMTGAINLEQGILKGSILLNLDTEDDDEFSIGCAGGIDTNTSVHFPTSAISSDETVLNIVVRGLTGGHSGVDIHLERANANKLMNRLMLDCENYGLRIVSIDGGSLRNAIPRESFATVAVSDSRYLDHFNNVVTQIKEEYATKELNLEITISETEAENALGIDDSSKVIFAIQACHNGVFRMSPTIEGLVETSSSLARVVVQEGTFTTQSLQRSSIETGKMDVARTVAAPFILMGCDVEHTGSYPGWTPNPDSEILEVMKSKYESLFNSAPNVSAIHAGLECGLLGERYPGLDMISFGPNIRGAHSPDERCSISSTQKFWSLLVETLKDTPLK